NSNGSYVDMAAELDLNHTMRTTMSLWFDYDNDKDLDLVVMGDCYFDELNCPGITPFLFYENQEGKFVDVTSLVGLNGYGPISTNQNIGGTTAGDLNQDDFIDFIVTVRNGKLLTFVNNGDKTFTESSEIMGMPTGNNKYYQPMIVDLNQDGLLDVYCNVDFGSNIFLLNRGNGFKDNSIVSNLTNSFNEMGMTIGDFDNDLDLDIYATNIENYLGNDYHNILLKNRRESGNFIFEEVSKDFEVESGGWGWGATFFDANCDGRLDLATTNGWDVPFEVIDQSKFFINNGENFIDESVSSGFNDEFNAATLISFDYNRDGQLDLFQTTRSLNSSEFNSRLLKNSGITTNGFIIIQPRMMGNNHFALGTKVDLFHNNFKQTRIIHAGTSFYGQEPYEAHFGVGQDISIDSVLLYWPGGAVSKEYNISINQILQITDADVLHRPSALTARLEEKDVVLSWSDRSHNESGFILERIKIGKQNSETYFQVNQNQTSYLDSSVYYNGIYQYRIQAVNDAMNSGYSDFVEISTLILSTEQSNSSLIKIYPNPVISTESGSQIMVKCLKSEAVLNVIDNLGKTVAFEMSSLDSDEILLAFKPEIKGIFFLLTDQGNFRFIIK
ncbi:MAG: FG-GAP-like repeat-containing protein, partial [Fulvivirga sp.]|uniref:FG-GAP-like repeat-containing protein n=1 Tax=Fulvivirga sp. TaxID=1931237 RepID=UPI0032EF9F7D